LPPCCGIPIEEDDIRRSLSSINIILDHTTFAQALSDRVSQSKFDMSVGSVSAGDPKNNDLFVDDPTTIETNI